MWHFLSILSIIFMIEVHFNECTIEIKRNYKGDLFVLNKSENCSEKLCGEHNRQAVHVPWKNCHCQCLSVSPSYRQDTRMCVDDISECRLIPFQSPVASENIPLVFLPTIGNNVHCSAEIVLDKVAQSSHLTCHVLKERFLTNKGWLTLKNLTRNGLTFQLTQESQKVFLQFVGTESIQRQLEGQLILVELACQTENNANVIPHPCVAFRVAGFLSGSSSLQETRKRTNWLIIGLGAALLGFTYILAILIYLIVRKKQELNESDDFDNIQVIYNPSNKDMSEANQKYSSVKEEDFLTRLCNVWMFTRKRVGGDHHRRNNRSKLWNNSLVEIPEESASVCGSIELDDQCPKIKDHLISKDNCLADNQRKVNSKESALHMKDNSTQMASAISGNWSARHPTPNSFRKSSDKSGSKNHRECSKCCGSCRRIVKSSSLNMTCNTRNVNCSGILRQYSCRNDSSNTKLLKSVLKACPTERRSRDTHSALVRTNGKCDCVAKRSRPPVKKEEHYYSMTDSMRKTLADHGDGQRKHRDLPPLPTTLDSLQDKEKLDDSGHRSYSKHSLDDGEMENGGTVPVNQKEPLKELKCTVTQLCRKKYVHKCRGFEKHLVEVEPPEVPVNGTFEADIVATAECQHPETATRRTSDSSASETKRKSVSFDPNDTVIAELLTSTTDEQHQGSVGGGQTFVSFATLGQQVNLKHFSGNNDAGAVGVSKCVATKVARSESSALDYGTLMLQQKQNNSKGNNDSSICRSESIQRDSKLRTVYERLQKKHEDVEEKDMKSLQGQGVMVLSLIDSFNKKSREISKEISLQNRGSDGGLLKVTDKRLLHAVSDDCGYQSGDSEWSASAGHNILLRSKTQCFLRETEKTRMRNNTEISESFINDH